MRDRLSEMAQTVTGAARELPAGVNENRRVLTQSLAEGDLEAQPGRTFRLVTVEEAQIFLPHWVNYMKIVLLLVLTAAAVLPFLPFAWLNRQRNKALDARKVFQSENVSVAVFAIFQQVTAWLEATGNGGGNLPYTQWNVSIAPVYADRFAACARLFEEAAYSTHSMREDQRKDKMPKKARKQTANQVNDQAEETTTQTVAAPAAEQMGISEDADAADSALTYFTVLLQDRMGSLFECQRQTVYWETEQDHVTIHQSAPEHALILNAGCYDVSARLLPENLLVDDGWVLRKNPGVIVKVVDSSVLGSGVGSTGAAKSICQQMLGREGWASMGASKSGRILLISREMLEAPYLQTAAMVMVAKAANPSLLLDVDPEEMLQMLTEEATGLLPTGIYYYAKED